MSQPSRPVVVGAAVALAVVAAALMAGQSSRHHVSANKHRAWSDFESSAPVDTRCLVATAVATPAALQLFELETDGGLQYVLAKVCGSPSNSESPGLPPGIVGAEATYEEVAYDGGPRLEVVLAGEPEWPCACSTGANCEALVGGAWVAAAKSGNTLGEGAWRGAGCVRKACTELAGYEGRSMPTECM